MSINQIPISFKKLNLGFCKENLKNQPNRAKTERILSALHMRESTGT